MVPFFQSIFGVLMIILIMNIVYFKLRISTFHLSISYGYLQRFKLIFYSILQTKFHKYLPILYEIRLGQPFAQIIFMRKWRLLF
jgi:hypothetical protein